MDKQEYELACRLSDYMLKMGIGFVFLEDGRMFTKEQCEEIINRFNTL